MKSYHAIVSFTAAVVFFFWLILQVRLKDHFVAFGLDTFSEVDEASPLSSKYQTMAQVRPMNHSVAFRLDACSEVDEASTSSPKYRAMAQVRPKDHSVVFGLDACLEVDEASTSSPKHRTMVQVRPKDLSIALIICHQISSFAKIEPTISFVGGADPGTSIEHHSFHIVIIGRREGCVIITSSSRR